MSYTVDNRAVHMEFDNRQFEQNIRTTMSSLDKFKEKLNLTGATKGIEAVDRAAGKVNMSPLGSAVEQVQAKFSALQVIGVTALANITNSAVNAGKQLVNALAIAPIKTGFQEYELKMGAVQTIMASTGASIDTVNAYLQELNEYSDKTIYSFSDMTQNIGKFTNAGVKLEDAVAAMKGISNEAALSGANANEASRAMYNLSQAMSMGYVQYIDWKSIENANMATMSFKQQLRDTALEMGVLKETTDGYVTSTGDAYTLQGLFKDGMKDQWLTSEVLVETLKDYADETTEIGKKAYDAATKIKTATMLMDTLKEAAQSGWAQTWEILVGDLNEGTKLWTSIGNAIGGFIDQTSKVRNDALFGGLASGWKQFLKESQISGEDYADAIMEVARKNGDAFDTMVGDASSFEEALREGLKSGVINADDMTKALDDLCEKMISTGTTAEKINVDEFVQKSEEEIRAFQESVGILADGIIGPETLGAIDEYNSKITESVSEYTEEQIEAVTKLRDQLKDGTLSMEEYTKSILAMSGRENIIDALYNSFNALLSILSPIKEAFTEIFPPITGEQIFGFTEKLKTLTEQFKISDETLDKLKRTFKGLFSILDIGKKALSLVFTPIKNFITGGALSGISSSLLDVTASIGDFFTKLNEGLSFDEASGSLSEGIAKIGDAISQALKGMGDIIGDTLSWLTDNVSFSSVLKGLIGGGVFALVNKLGSLVDKVKDIFKGFGENKNRATSSFKEVLGSLRDGLTELQTGIKATVVLEIAAAVALLVDSIDKLSKLSIEDIAVSVGAIGVIMTELEHCFKKLMISIKQFGVKGVNKAALAMILIAEAVKILSDAIIKLADLSWEDLAKALFGTAVAMAELVGAVKLLGSDKILGKTEFSLKTILAILVVAKACQMLADALASFALLSWGAIGRGLTAMGGALTELVATIKILGGAGLKAGNALAGSFSILIVSKALDDVAAFMERISALSWSDIGKGLTAMGGALIELGGVSGALGYLVGIAGFAGAGTITLASTALDNIATSLIKFGSMTWDEIGRGLAGMAAALLEVAGISGALGYFTGIAGFAGAGTITIAAQELDKISEALIKFGSMSWGEIGRGLVAMGGALLEVGTISGALGVFTGIAGIAGAGTITLAAQGLDEIAIALEKFGSMQWDEIGRGLVAMGAAMADVSFGSLLNVFSTHGASAIATVAAPLGELADSVKKWTDVTVPDGIGTALGNLASGVVKFTFSGFGANAIKDVAAPLGIMGESMKSWDGVKVPDGIGDGLKSLASGVGAFTLAGWGADAVTEISAPIGILGESIQKWNGVTIPGTLESQLKSLAKGIGAFSFTNLGAVALSDVAAPLGVLADSINKWKDVVIPETLGEDLSSLVSAISPLSSDTINAETLNANSSALTSLQNALFSFTGLTIDETLVTSITTFFESLSSISENSGTAVESLAIVLTSLAESISEATVTFSTAGTALMQALNTSISGYGPTIKETIRSIMQGVVTAINNFRSQLQQAAIYAGQGIVAGLASMWDQCYAMGYALGEAVNAGFNDALAIKSPSRVMYKSGVHTGQGVVNGIVSMVSKVYQASKDLGNSANDGFNSAISDISDRVSAEIDTSPRITPILDLSNVEQGASRLAGIFNGGTIRAASQANNIASSKSDSDMSVSPKSITPVVNNNFTQNNYSPKALSRAEIYRQTKSQFSAMERMANA